MASLRRGARGILKVLREKYHFVLPKILAEMTNARVGLVKSLSDAVSTKKRSKKIIYKSTFQRLLPREHRLILMICSISRKRNMYNFAGGSCRSRKLIWTPPVATMKPDVSATEGIRSIRASIHVHTERPSLALTAREAGNHRHRGFLCSLWRVRGRKASAGQCVRGTDTSERTRARILPHEP